MYRLLFVLLMIVSLGCSGDDESSNNANNENNVDCTPTSECNDNEVQRMQPCAGCRELNNGCETIYCEVDTTCDEPCAAGEYEPFEGCDPDNDTACTVRFACGGEVACRTSAACLAETTCSDGGVLLDACPQGSTGCLPTQVCGTTKYCPTLQACEREGCDPGESPTIVSCAEITNGLPCREIDACGGAGQVTCVCAAEALLCMDDEDFDTNPCVPGQQCREVMGCGQTFYCKGESI